MVIFQYYILCITMRTLYFVFFLGIEQYMLPCFTKKIFGFDCPGCGLQRSLVLLLKGDFNGAFHMYPAIYPMLLLFVFLALNYFITIRFSNSIKITLISVTVGVIVINYISKFI
ncbi:DUF2752 domain-containing protein [Maribacter sp. CXY002]|uniref:DUF2752 domain-containing protein n=1 Tax=Maribacter luteocoastalis TaxID=3407671 RepID=UPI003B66CF4D